MLTPQYYEKPFKEARILYFVFILSFFVIFLTLCVGSCFTSKPPVSSLMWKRRISIINLNILYLGLSLYNLSFLTLNALSSNLQYDPFLKKYVQPLVYWRASSTSLGIPSQLEIDLGYELFTGGHWSGSNLQYLDPVKK